MMEHFKNYQNPQSSNPVCKTIRSRLEFGSKEYTSHKLLGQRNARQQFTGRIGISRSIIRIDSSDDGRADYLVFLQTLLRGSATSNAVCILQDNEPT
jgi:hypothetical protein